MTTLRQIAQEAGVHIATASAVLNSPAGNTRVSTETRQRVLDVAKRLSYVPNESARRLRTGRSNVVGFLGGDLRNPFFAELTAALEGELSHIGLQLMVSHIAQTEGPIIERTVAHWRQQSVRDIILWEESSDRRKTKISTETLSIGFTIRERPGVWLDLDHAVQIAVKGLVNRGFRKLGFYLPRNHSESPSAANRLASFIEVCEKLRLPQPTVASYLGESWDLAASVQGAPQVLKDHPGVDAWIGFNDIASLGLLSHLPRKSSARVLCFDGTSLSRCWPGHPPHLDLRIPEFAKRIVTVISKKKPASSWGKRSQWLSPELVEP